MPAISLPCRARAGVLLVAGVAAASCGGSSPASAVRLTSASDCAQWSRASREARQDYIAQAVRQPVEAHGHYELGHAQAFLDGWLTEGCEQASKARNAATTRLGSIASGSAAIAESHGEAVPPTGSTTTATSTPAPTTTTDKPAPSPPPAAPPFWLAGTTQNGDKFRLEGRYGPIQTASETEVNHEVLDDCPSADGRELIAELALTATIESSLPGQVIVGGFVPPYADVSHLIDLILGYSDGPTCETVTEESQIAINLGTLQPHEPHVFVMWVVLPDAITPNDPHPSYQTLAKQNWVIGAVEASVDGSGVKILSGGSGKGLAVIR